MNVEQMTTASSRGAEVPAPRNGKFVSKNSSVRRGGAIMRRRWMTLSPARHVGPRRSKNAQRPRKGGFRHLRPAAKSGPTGGAGWKASQRFARRKRQNASAKRPCFRAARRTCARAPPAPTPEVGANQLERQMQKRPRNKPLFATLAASNLWHARSALPRARAQVAPLRSAKTSATLGKNAIRHSRTSDNLCALAHSAQVSQRGAIGNPKNQP